MKKCLIALLLSALLLFTACATGGKIDAQAIFAVPSYDWGHITGETLNIWCKKGEMERSYMKTAIARYEKLTGNHINIVEINVEEFDEKVSSALNTPSSDLDILLSYGGTNLDAFNPDENFCDFKNEVWINDIMLNGLNQAIYNGRIVGLPHWEASFSGTLYNKKIFKKYKIPIPTTQKEFLNACEILLKNGVTPLYLPYKEITMLLYQFPLDAVLEKNDNLSRLNSGAIDYKDIPQMRSIIEWYKTMSDRGYFGEDYIQNDWNGMDNALKSEKYAMMLCWDTWLYTDFTGNANKFGIMPAFMGFPENGVFEGANLSLLIANKNGKRISTARDFITFMADPYNYNVAFKDCYTAPVFRNQIASVSTPQIAKQEQAVQRLYHPSTAWLRVKGFSQIDARYIQKHITDSSYTLDNCIADMDRARKERAKQS
ncbi:MAG: extracellular solute-binding protein [Oscillospiraceae bacterium]